MARLRCEVSSIRLGYDLTIEQAQKLVMTPELIQAIQILQFNTQELDNYVQEQVLVNPVLEQGQSEPEDRDRSKDESEYSRSEKLDAETGREEQRQDEILDWKEYIRNSSYGDESYGWSEKDSPYKYLVIKVARY